MLDPASFSPGSASSPASSGQPANDSVQSRLHSTGLARYGVAVMVVLVAFALRWAIFGHLDNRLPFAFFLPAVMIAAWYGGLGPGVLAAVSSLLVGDYFFLPPHDAWGPLGEAARTAVTVFALTSTIVLLLIEDLHARIRRLKNLLREQQAVDGCAEKR